jgi:hypothetical protein
VKQFRPLVFRRSEPVCVPYCGYQDLHHVMGAEGGHGCEHDVAYQKLSLTESKLRSEFFEKEAQDSEDENQKYYVGDGRHEGWMGISHNLLLDNPVYVGGDQQKREQNRSQGNTFLRTIRHKQITPYCL